MSVTKTDAADPHAETLERLRQLPSHVLARELLHMAQTADRAAATSFLNYKFMPDEAALDLGAHDLFSAGWKPVVGKSALRDRDGEVTADRRAVPRRLPSLDFDAELSHNLDDEAAGPVHRLLIGDNYHALAGLQSVLATHPDGLYDLIYIDPPYNTGKGGTFAYNDNYVDSHDPWRSTKWVSVMEPRLILARKLLTRTGVVFISIDDNELYSLKLLCDNVFGKANFIANLVWEGSGKNNADFTAGGVDYILVYAKTRDSLSSDQVRWRERKEDLDVVYAAGEASWRDADGDPETARALMQKWLTTATGKALPEGIRRYVNFTDDGALYKLDDPSAPGGARYDVIHPVTGRVCRAPSRGWGCSENTMKQRIANGDMVFGSDERTLPMLKKLLSSTENQAPANVIRQPRRSATGYLNNILGDKVFSNPKDHTVLARWFGMAAGKDAKILDFFGGSGSTAEAVLALNAEDGGAREVTIVTNDENGIGTRITRERIVRVMTGQNWADGKPHKGYGGRLSVHRVGAVITDDVHAAEWESERHCWDFYAGAWGAWADTPIPAPTDGTHERYVGADGETALVFSDINTLRTSHVDAALAEHPGARVFLPHIYSPADRGAPYVDDVPNEIGLPDAVLGPVSAAVCDSVVRPYRARGGHYVNDVEDFLTSKRSTES